MSEQEQSAAQLEQRRGAAATARAARKRQLEHLQNARQQDAALAVFVNQVRQEAGEQFRTNDWKEIRFLIELMADTLHELFYEKAVLKVTGEQLLDVLLNEARQTLRG